MIIREKVGSPMLACPSGAAQLRKSAGVWRKALTQVLVPSSGWAVNFCPGDSSSPGDLEVITAKVRAMQRDCYRGFFARTREWDFFTQFPDARNDDFVDAIKHWRNTYKHAPRVGSSHTHSPGLCDPTFIYVDCLRGNSLREDRLPLTWEAERVDRLNRFLAEVTFYNEFGKEGEVIGRRLLVRHDDIELTLTPTHRRCPFSLHNDITYQQTCFAVQSIRVRT